MRLDLYKLNFKGYLHTGAGFQEETVAFPGSDTLFLAVASTIAEISGENKLKEFCETRPRFSSAFPYFKQIFFLPKPIGIQRLFRESELENKLKKVKWVEKEIIRDGIWKEAKYTEKFATTDDIEEDALKGIYTEEEIVRNTKDRITENTKIFTIRVFKFSKQSGLYFLYSGEYDIEEAVKVLGEVGIGSGKSVGYGRFSVEKEEFNWDSNGEFGLLISKFVPKKEEVKKLAKSWYKIEEKGGWTGNYRKKKLKMLTEGSVLPRDVEGRMIKEKLCDKIEIWRNYLALILPLKWWSK